MTADKQQYHLIIQVGNRKQTIRLFTHRSFWLCVDENFDRMGNSDGYATGDNPSQALARFFLDFKMNHQLTLPRELFKLAGWRDFSER